VNPPLPFESLFSTQKSKTKVNGAGLTALKRQKLWRIDVAIYHVGIWPIHDIYNCPPKSPEVAAKMKLSFQRDVDRQIIGKPVRIGTAREVTS
jgi:hypothetical protein